MVKTMPNRLQKIARFMLSKATGFPTWGLTDPWPGGAGSVDGYGDTQPMQLAAVYACSRILAQAIGSIPFNVYSEDKNGVRTKATDEIMYSVLHDTPNAYMTSMEWREAMILGFCLRGNGFSEKSLNGQGNVIALTPLRADRMQVVRQPWNTRNPLVYRFNYDTGKTEDLPPEKILHLKNFSMDGIEGMTPIRRLIIEHALYAQSYGRNFFRNSGRPSGVLSSEQKRPNQADATDKMRKEWNETSQGPDKAGNTAVLWYGLKYDAISLAPEEAQYIETRKLSDGQICALYGVPAHMVNQTETPTYASAEQFDLQLVKHTYRPLCVRFESAVNRACLKGTGLFSEFDLDGLQRGDSTAQASYFSTLTQNGIMTRNESRRKLNLPEVKGADELTVQSNLIDLDKLASITNRNNAAAAAGGQ